MASDVPHKVVSRDEWNSLRGELLKKEKELTRASDALAVERRSLPWVEIDKAYTFQTTSGPKSLADLFNGKSQLLVYHFMLGPGWKAGCPSCSFWADNFSGMKDHLPHRDVAFTAISRASSEEIETYKKRMGWEFDWVSSEGSDFNVDMGATVDKVPEKRFPDHPEREGIEQPGMSVFYRDGEKVYRTYHSTGRGLEAINAVYGALDLCPKGRDEGKLPWPMEWIRRHDEY
jgi:predicted dithiol-disulfide oxidoreductase (DUF899 family)